MNSVVQLDHEMSKEYNHNTVECLDAMEKNAIEISVIHTWIDLNMGKKEKETKGTDVRKRK